MQSLSERLQNIAAKLATVDSQKLHLNPPLTPAQLKQIESQYGLYLPTDYRAFLLQLGDGGAGPYYGITPLAHAAQAAGHQPETLPLCDQGCTYTAHLVLHGPGRGRIRYSADPNLPRDESFLDWYERWLDELLTGDPSPRFGFDDDAPSKSRRAPTRPNSNASAPPSPSTEPQQ